MGIVMLEGLLHEPLHTAVHNLKFKVFISVAPSMQHGRGIISLLQKAVMIWRSQLAITNYYVAEVVQAGQWTSRNQLCNRDTIKHTSYSIQSWYVNGPSPHSSALWNSHEPVDSAVNAVLFIFAVCVRILVTVSGQIEFPLKWWSWSVVVHISTAPGRQPGPLCWVRRK